MDKEEEKTYEWVIIETITQEKRIRATTLDLAIALSQDKSEPWEKSHYGISSFTTDI